MAHSQSAGRGRSGRKWHSRPGNLYASYYFKPACSLDAAPQLSFLASLALYDTIIQISKDKIDARLLGLKWPNDILLEGRKLVGILLESSQDPAGGRNNIVIGNGLNLAHHPQPQDLRQGEATALIEYGVECAPREALSVLAQRYAAWLKIWDEGRGFSQIREAWLAKAIGLGSEISIQHNQENSKVRFMGIDGSGAMLYQDGQGQVKRLMAGDVFF